MHTSQPPRSGVDWVALHGDEFRSLRVLVTGGAGFIGSHLSEALVRLGAAVVVLDDLSGTGGSRANLESFDPGGGSGGSLEFVRGSVLDPGTVARCALDCAYVFHQAALGSVPRSVAEPRLFHDVNSTGTLNVLEAARAAGVRRVMFAASSSAYGESEVLPKVETMPVQPLSPYAANKVAGEALMRAYGSCYATDTVSLRYFNIFGPRQNANSAYAAVIAAFAKALLGGRRPVIYGDGEQSRDFTFVANAVHANLLAARSSQPLCGTVVNVAVGTRVTVNELAAAMARLLGRPELRPVHEQTRAGDVKHSLADLARAREVLGYRRVVEFEPGLQQTVAWYQTVGA
jgi:nucleoside-diphosphate-sugar epimerase